MNAYYAMPGNRSCHFGNDTAAKFLKAAPVRFERMGALVGAQGVDYKLMKLFQLSVLWRASVAQQMFFERVRLGEHEEVVRQMLEAEDPGPANRYPCVMFGVRFLGQPMKGVVIQPVQVVTDGATSVRFVFGAFLWVFHLQGESMHPALLTTCVQPSGTLIFTTNEAETLPELRDFAERRAELCK